MEINGIAHVQLTIRDPERSIPFYERLCHFVGMKTLLKVDDFGIYCIGSKTGIAAFRQDGTPAGDAFDQARIGLHHLCLRARRREDVDELYELVRDELEATIVHPPEEGPWAPGYYSVLFEDPDGIRIEVNHVPGRGHLDELDGS